MNVLSRSNGLVSIQLDRETDTHTFKILCEVLCRKENSEIKRMGIVQ